MDEFKKICNVLIEQVKLLKLTQINFDDLPEKEYESLLEMIKSVEGMIGKIIEAKMKQN